MWVVKMTNGRGFQEWFWEGLVVRAQARKKEWARKFESKDEAQRAADMCERLPEAFSEIYFDHASGKWTLTATVEPA